MRPLKKWDIKATLKQLKTVNLYLQVFFFKEFEIEIKKMLEK